MKQRMFFPVSPMNWPTWHAIAGDRWQGKDGALARFVWNHSGDNILDPIEWLIRAQIEEEIEIMEREVKTDVSLETQTRTEG